MSIIDELRRVRIPLTDMALFDWVATILAAILLTPLVKYFIKGNFALIALIILLILLAISIPLHKLLKVPTVTNYYLHLSERPSRL